MFDKNPEEIELLLVQTSYAKEPHSVPSLDMISNRAQALILSFFSREEIRKYVRTSKSIHSLSNSNCVWASYLKPNSENKITENAQLIFDTQPERRLAQYWPFLQGKEAIKFYEKVLRKDSNDLDARSGLAFWTIMGLPDDKKTIQEEKNEGIRAMLEMLELNPQHANSFYYLARLTEENHAKLSQDDFPIKLKLPINFTEAPKSKAAVLYRKALEINPNHPEANYYLGMLFEENNAIAQSKDFSDKVIPRTAAEQAAILYRKALAKDPQNSQYPPFADARCRLAELIRQGKITAERNDFYGQDMPQTPLAQCQALYQQVLDANPNHPKAIFLRELVKKEKLLKSELMQVSRNKWARFIRQRVITHFEELSREQQLLIIAAVQEAQK